MTVLKFQHHTVKFTPNFNKGEMECICRILCEEKRIKLGDVGSPLYLDRRIHKAFVPLHGIPLQLTGTIKIEYVGDMLKNAVFFVDNSELLLNLYAQDEKIHSSPVQRRIRLG